MCQGDQRKPGRFRPRLVAAGFIGDAELNRSATSVSRYCPCSPPVREGRARQLDRFPLCHVSSTEFQARFPTATTIAGPLIRMTGIRRAHVAYNRLNDRISAGIRLVGFGGSQYGSAGGGIGSAPVATTSFAPGLEHMAKSRKGRYPYHLATLVAQRLRAKNLLPPSDEILLQLFETLYFASMRTEEGRPCRCTINYVSPEASSTGNKDSPHANHWTTIPFQQPLPFEVRVLTKLAEAVDPSTASLAVYSDNDQLFIWGLVDQELRYADLIAADATTVPERPGLFQATITNLGNVCVYDDYALLASLEQSHLVDSYHDVIWSGPVHEALNRNLQSSLADQPTVRGTSPDVMLMEKELSIRWHNAVCRILMNIQQYRHGGGLLIVPDFPAPDLNVKYHLMYDRLPQALLGLVRYHLLKRQTSETIAKHCRHLQANTLPCDFHFDAVAYQKKLDEHRAEALGCVRFISSLSRVDGFVVADKSLAVYGFGVELLADSQLTDIFIAGDSLATPRLQRKGSLSQYGTRHRAMMRYCSEHPGSLGFVISQDGDIRATMRHGDRVILWENINAQLAFRSENRSIPISDVPSMMDLFQYWSQSVTGIAS